MSDCAPIVAAEADAPKGRAARGPFRPDVWLNARQRSGVRLAAHYFRAIDVLVVAAIALIAATWAAPAGVLSLSVAEAAPVLLGVGVTLGLMRALGLYRFDRGQPALVHLLGAAAVVIVGVGTALLLSLALARQGLGVVAPWGVGALVALPALHAVWLSVVGRWRRAGVRRVRSVCSGAASGATCPRRSSRAWSGS